MVMTTLRHERLRLCGEAAPPICKPYLDWDLPDPHSKSIDEVRIIRDEIDRRVRALLLTSCPRG
jgi:arsenate reductase